VLISRKATGDWDEGGLGISGPEEILLGPNEPLKSPTHPSLITQQSAPGQMEHSVSRAKGPAPQRSLEKLKAKRESIEKRRNEGSVDSADDEDDELGRTNCEGNSGSASSQHYRSKSALPSSKLGIEMMRANSHDSVTAGGSESTGTAEPTTQVVTPNQELKLEFPQLATTSDPTTPPPYLLDDEAETTVIISTPPEPGPGGSAKVDIDETPRPIAVVEREIPEDEEPTPRAAVKSAGRDTISPFPGAI
jgi:serine/threonine-protein kinase RIM15